VSAKQALASDHEAGAATVVGPSDCAIAFGIPTCRMAFEVRLKHGTCDYLRRFAGWPEYEFRFVRFLTELEPGLREIGVTVERDATVSSFAKLFERHRVVVLFSHWNDEDPDFPLGAVELDEGTVAIETLVDAVPQDFEGFLDLCVCHPRNLASALWEARPRCRVKRLNNVAQPDFWLYFYGTLFHRLHQEPTSYPKALVRTRDELTRKARDGRTA
jgi:hypothetical protein